MEIASVGAEVGKKKSRAQRVHRTGRFFWPVRINNAFGV
jgi:hypothetical protein